MAAQLSSKQIKFIKSLGQKKFRDEYNLFVAEGEKVVEEALNSNFKIKEIYKESEIGAECMGRITNLKRRFRTQRRYAHGHRNSEKNCGKGKGFI